MENSVETNVENMTTDTNSQNKIRQTGNVLTEWDREAPQHNRLLSQEEIEALVKEAQDGDC